MTETSESQSFPLGFEHAPSLNKGAPNRRVKEDSKEEDDDAEESGLDAG